jgi:hypothetical protein
LNYRIVDIGELPVKITNFADTRNSILDTLENGEYVLWKSADEELSQMLTDHIERLKPEFPYYAIRRINLIDGHYSEQGNPEYSPHLVSNQVRYKGAIHEQVKPRKPYGRIDYPIIHNHPWGWKYTSGWKQTNAYRPILALKKGLQVALNR